MATQAAAGKRAETRHDGRCVIEEIANEDEVAPTPHHRGFRQAASQRRVHQGGCQPFGCIAG